MSGLPFSDAPNVHSGSAAGLQLRPRIECDVAAEASHSWATQALWEGANFITLEGRLIWTKGTLGCSDRPLEAAAVLPWS